MTVRETGDRQASIVEVQEQRGSRQRGLRVYVGPARRVSGPAEFGRIVKGDVLVTESATEALNIRLPLLTGASTGMPAK